VVKFLVENGADIASLTSSGASPLWWARRTLEPGHSVIQFLEDLGAPEVGEL
jgi:ankyrin repeat protein